MSPCRAFQGLSGLAVLLLVSCEGADSRPVERSARTALFRTLVRELARDSAGGTLAVDPRPLRADRDSLIAMHGLRHLFVDTTGAGAPWEPAAADEVADRRAILQELNVVAATGFPERNCPGVLLVSRMTPAARAMLDCPPERLRVYLISNPLPSPDAGPAARRARQGAITSATIWAISRHYLPQGAIELSFEYRFDRRGADWLLIERRPLLIVE